MLLWWPY